MRVLYLIPSPLDSVPSGGGHRLAQIADAMRSNGSEVMVRVISPECPVPAPRESRLRRPIRVVSDGEWHPLKCIVATQRIDVVVANHPCAHDAVALAELGVQVVVTTHNFEARLQMARARRRTWREHAILVASDALYLRRAARVWTVSEHDRSAYRRFYHPPSVTTMPIAVDLLHYPNCRHS